MPFRMFEPGDSRDAAWMHRALLSVVVLLLLFQFATLFEPIIGEHCWRQADTYSVARNFHRVSANFFYPRIDWNFGRSGIMAMEAPIYPYVTHLFMYLLGDGPGTARFVAWAFFVCGVVAAFWLMRSIGGNTLAAAFPLVLVVSPMVLFETRQIQPDGPSMGLLLVAAAFFYRFSAAGGAWRFVLGMAAFSVATLIRPTALLIGPAMWLFSIAARPASWRELASRGVWFAIPLGMHFGWFAWAAHLDALFDEGRGYFAVKVNWDHVYEDVKDASRLKNVFGFVLPGYAMSWTLLPAVATGAVLSFSKRQRRVSVAFWAWLTMGIVFCFMFSRRFHSHWYYATPFVPPLAYFAALSLRHLMLLARPGVQPSVSGKWLFFFLSLSFIGVAYVGGPWVGGDRAAGASGPGEHHWLTIRGLWCALCAAAVATAFARLFRGEWKPRMALALVVISLLSVVSRGGHDVVRAFVWRARLTEWRAFDRKYESMRRSLDCYSTADETLLTDGGNTWHLYAASRRGFADEPSAIREHGLQFYRQHGVRVLLHFGEAKDPLKSADGLGKRLASGKKWELYCISSDGCPPLPTCDTAAPTTKVSR